ncbi:uncharacterized protein At4g14100-like [Tasmannia lanceolata]|uniref:uncharacterized protein At4g14100-like n=1 Tax=Tasmannia lanceolata TaxID=3420 RepID=UPI004062EAE5
MKSATQIASPPLLFLFFLFFFVIVNRPIRADGSDPTPSPWPLQFHALLYMNLTSTGHLQITNLWYDWPKGRNFNIMQKQMGELLHDLEWNNGTSFYYTVGAQGECETMEFEVGIPRPNWVDGSTYLGQKYTDGFLCNVWEKLDFIWYYEDVSTKKPIRWDFYDGITTHVMTFEVGAVLEDSQWQAPAYCFGDGGKRQARRESPKRDRESPTRNYGIRALDFSNRKLI